MASGFHVTIEGLRDAIRALDYFPKNLRNKWLRIALNAAGGVLLAAVRPLMPRQTGLAYRSLGVKTKLPRGAYGYTLVGARRRFGRAVARVGGKTQALTARKTTKHLRAGGKARFRDPTRYLHLIENDHKNRGGGVTPGRHPLATAGAAAYPQARTKAVEKLREGVFDSAAGVRRLIGGN